MSKNKNWLTATAFFLTAVVVVALAVAPEPNNSWLPLNRPDLVRLISKGINNDSLTVQSLDESVGIQRVKLKSNAKKLERFEQRFAEKAKLLSPNDTISFVHGAHLPFELTMAGSDEKIHTLRIFVPIVNLNKKESDQTLNILKNLFATIYPDWPEAMDWPETSLSQAWDMHPVVRKETLDNLNELFIRKKINDITSSTFGVPPDLVVYTITTRDRCIPTPAQGNPFQRIIC